MDHMISSVLLPAISSSAGSKAAVLLYLGPETIMPLASILAAAVGILLIAWRYVVNFFKQAFRFIRAKIRREPLNHEIGAEPEFEMQDEV